MMKTRNPDNDNVLDFSKEKRLPSLEGTSDEEVQYIFAKQRQEGTTTIEWGKHQLEVPDFAVENAKNHLVTLSRQGRRRLKRKISKRIERCLTIMESPQTPQDELEHMMEESVDDLVLGEGLRQLEDERVA